MSDQRPIFHGRNEKPRNESSDEYWRKPLGVLVGLGGVWAVYRGVDGLLSGRLHVESIGLWRRILDVDVVGDAARVAATGFIAIGVAAFPMAIACFLKQEKRILWIVSALIIATVGVPLILFAKHGIAGYETF